MKAAHSADHEALVLQLLVDDDSEIARPIPKQVEECQECQNMLAELRGTQSAVGEALSLERARISATPSGSAIDLALVQECVALASRGASRPSVRKPGSLVRPALMAAAALLFALGLWWNFERNRTTQAPVYLGVSDSRAVRPVGRMDFRVFEWNATLGPGERFELRIFPAEGTDVLHEALNLRANRWEASETEGWGTSIRWEVRRVSDGVFVDSFEAYAERSR